jgi:CBS domain-containing protein
MQAVTSGCVHLFSCWDESGINEPQLLEVSGAGRRRARVGCRRWLAIFPSGGLVPRPCFCHFAERRYSQLGWLWTDATIVEARGSRMSKTKAPDGFRARWRARVDEDLITAALVIVACLLVLTVVHRLIGADTDAVLSIAILLPVLIYALVSGRIAELKAGGIEAKFREAGERPVAPSSAVVTAVDAQSIEKGTLSELRSATSGIDGNRPVLLQLYLGSTTSELEIRRYTGHEVERYIQALSRFRQFRFVVVLDSERQVVGYIEPDRLLRVLIEDGDYEQPGKFYDLINRGEATRLRENYRQYLITDVIETSTTNREALSLMQSLNADAMLVVDDRSKRLVGVVERSAIITEFLLGPTD